MKMKKDSLITNKQRLSGKKQYEYIMEQSKKALNRVNKTKEYTMFD